MEHCSTMLSAPNKSGFKEYLLLVLKHVLQKGGGDINLNTYKSCFNYLEKNSQTSRFFGNMRKDIERIENFGKISTKICLSNK